MSVDFAGLDSTIAAHLSDIGGVLACHGFLRQDQGTWQEIALIGPVNRDAASPFLQSFDPAAGGSVQPLAGDQKGWLASYSCSSGAVEMLMLFTLRHADMAQLQPVLEQLESKMGWILVAAQDRIQKARAALDLPTEIGAALLVESATAVTRRELADQWIARLERALSPDLVAVLWTQTAKPILAAQSGGGEVERPSEAVDALKDVALTAIRARMGLFWGDGSAPQTDQEKLDAALGVFSAKSAMALPIYNDDICIAVVAVFWRGADAPVLTSEAGENLAQVLASSSMIQRRAHPTLRHIVLTWFRDVALAIVGKRAAKIKIFAAITALVLVIMALIPITQRPAFEARIEARNRYIISAPFDGFLQEAPYQLGDALEKGKTVLALEDAELRLQLARTTAETQRLDGEMQSALAQRDTAKLRTLDAQLRQAKVQVDLLNHQLEQSQLVALRDGVVVGGDAWRRIGGRVRQGEPLLEIADPASYAVAIYADESWVSDIAPQGTGTLLLAAHPNQPIAVQVRQVTSDTGAKTGGNAFLVWADVKTDTSPTAAQVPLLEGMRGIVRLDMARTSMLAAYTRGIRQWVSKTVWRWF